MWHTRFKKLFGCIQKLYWLNGHQFKSKIKLQLKSELETLLWGTALASRPILCVFVHFSQKLQHIGDKWNLFLTVNILRNLTTALEFTNPSGHWFMDQNIVNIDFHTLFISVTSQLTTMVSTEDNTKFWVPWNISNQVHGILCPKLLYFFEKIHKLFKNKVRDAVSP